MTTIFQPMPVRGVPSDACAATSTQVLTPPTSPDHYVAPAQTDTTAFLPEGMYTQAGVWHILEQARAMQDQSAFRATMAELASPKTTQSTSINQMNAAEASRLISEMATTTGISTEFVQAAVKQYHPSRVSIAEQMAKLGALPTRHAAASSLSPTVKDIMNRLLACYLDGEEDPKLFKSSSNISDPWENKEGKNAFNTTLCEQGFDYCYFARLSFIKGTKVPTPSWKFWEKEPHAYKWGISFGGGANHNALPNPGYFVLYCSSSNPSKIYINLFIKDPKLLMRCETVVADLRTQSMTVEVITEFTPADFR